MDYSLPNLKRLAKENKIYDYSMLNKDMLMKLLIEKRYNFRADQTRKGEKKLFP